LHHLPLLERPSNPHPPNPHTLNPSVPRLPPISSRIPPLRYLTTPYLTSPDFEPTSHFKPSNHHPTKYTRPLEQIIFSIHSFDKTRRDDDGRCTHHKVTINGDTRLEARD
jgi:hypothetical protein